VELVSRVVIGFSVAVVCTPAGISGAFLLLPIQVQFLQVPSPSVSPTNLLFNVVSAPAGAWAYYRARRLDVRLAVALCVGTAPGVIAGALLRSTWLADAKRFGVIAAAVLVLLGLRILIEAVRPARTRPTRDVLPPIWRLALIGTVAGLVGGIYGIGGAAVVVPWVTTVERLPVARAAGAGLVTTSATSMIGLATFAVAAQTGIGSASAPQWLDGLALGVGGVLGATLGVRLQPRVPERFLRVLLAIAAIVAGLRMW
jgi:uncharacterized membrane protein YfcA